MTEIPLIKTQQCKLYYLIFIIKSHFNNKVSSIKKKQQRVLFFLLKLLVVNSSLEIKGKYNLFYFLNISFFKEKITWFFSGVLSKNYNFSKS